MGEVRRTIPLDERYYKDDDGNIITESDFIAEFIKKCDHKFI